jgi:hypothetical protein
LAGCHGRCAQIPGHVDQIVELDRLVATDAGNRGLAAQIGVSEILHHRLAKPAFVIEHIVGDADRLGRHARVEDVLTGAAGALLGQGDAMVVELQGDPDHIIAGLFQQGRSDRGIDSARHGGDHAGSQRQVDGLGGLPDGGAVGDEGIQWHPIGSLVPPM